MHNSDSHRFAAVAFDIDGTLYPAWRFNLRILPFVLKNYRTMTALSRVRNHMRQIHAQTNEPFADFFATQAQLLAKELGTDPDEMYDFLQREIYTGWRKRFSVVKPFKTVTETMVSFRQAGLKIGILSDFPPEQKGDVWGLAQFCDVLIGSEYVGALKPSALPFFELSKRLSLEPCQILYVGNNQHDIRGAHAAGMKVACVTHAGLTLQKGADIFFSNYRQLQKYVLG